VSEEIKRLAGLLEDEMLGWPNVTSRPMFGLNGIYRGPNIFAVLPRTRAMEVPDSIAFRLLKRPRNIIDQLANDKQIVNSTPDAKWISFVIESDAEIHTAPKVAGVGISSGSEILRRWTAGGLSCSGRYFLNSFNVLCIK
jgi:hypothetical protein